MDIVEFLRARLDEDEQEARKAIAMREATPLVDKTLNTKPDYALMAWEDVGVPAMLVGPERVLREVEAKRATLNAFATCLEMLAQGHSTDYSTGEMDAYSSATRALATVYADHPDYRPAWR